MTADEPLRLTRFGDVRDFERVAGPFLADREAEHNLFLGILAQIKHGQYSNPYLVAVARGADVVGAAFRTSPHQMSMSHLDDPDAIDLIASDVHEAFEELPGVLGEPAAAARFVESWYALTGRRGELYMQQRIYECTAAEPPFGVSGTLRVGDEPDRRLIVDWVMAFATEAGDATLAKSPDAWVDDKLKQDRARGV
jgi:hypothetical protein